MATHKTHNVTIACETEGFDEAKEKIEALAEAYDGFPAQVTIRGCRIMQGANPCPIINYEVSA